MIALPKPTGRPEQKLMMVIRNPLSCALSDLKSLNSGWLLRTTQPHPEHLYVADVMGEFKPAISGLEQ